MPRLYDRAYGIMAAEVRKCADGMLGGQVQQDIVLRRLDRLRTQEGSPLTYQELRGTVIDFFPNFSEKVLHQAVNANRPPGAWFQIKLAVVLLAGSAGAIWVLNLPYPMIRWPVAKSIPIVLLPSYMSMDYHYRRAIALVEQADQLVNKATGTADLDLGAQKVKEAQKHLDALPVWFVGYWPKYTFWLGWKFTLDEFKASRQNISRMEAKLFQEKQAQTLLTQAEQALNAAKQEYDEAANVADKQKAIAAWQAAIDRVEEIPAETLVGRTARTKLAAYQRDFQQVATIAAKSTRTDILIETAREFATAASQKTKTLPLNSSQWQEVAKLWQQAIDQLEKVSEEDAGYVEAQKLLAQYQSYIGTVRTNLQVEMASAEALDAAKQETEYLLANSNSLSQDQMLAKIQSITNQLQLVKPGTTGYTEAQQLMRSAQNKLNELKPPLPKTGF